MKVIGMNINAEPMAFESEEELNKHNARIMRDYLNEHDKFSRILEKTYPKFKAEQDKVMQEDHGFAGLFDNK
jgi:hypothetical protein